MRRMRSGTSSRLAALLLAVLAGLLASPRRSSAAPDEFIPVGDPIEDELRVLDLYGQQALGASWVLPHFGMRPLQWIELRKPGVGEADLPAALRPSVIRIERAFERNGGPDWSAVTAGTRSTPRLIQRTWPDGERLEVSAGLEGAGEVDRHESHLVSGSGAHLRVALGLEHWLAYAHLMFARIDSGRTFADPIVANTDLIGFTEETYLAYTAASNHWSAQFGRSRWHWGPGDEASLVLSKTSAPLTGLALHARIEPLRLDLEALSATLDQAAGEQLAAHRIEWQASDAVRIGVTEAARYQSSGWQPLYLVGVLPYVLVQRLEIQDSPDSLRSLRNNEIFGVDAAWRVAPGSRVYGELLVDDLHAKSGAIPNKVAWQLGWEGAGVIASTRLTWGGELTRLTRYVYTSFFGRSYESQGLPLGFPTGPDARRLRLRLGCDLGPDWQLTVRTTSTDHGENHLNEPFNPGSPRVSSSSFEGVVEHTRELEAGVRWWPASGVDLAALGGYRWIENSGHVTGRDESGARASLELRLTR